MKKRISTSALVLMTMASFITNAQYTQHNAELYQKKIETYSKMQNTGYVLLGVGGGTLIAGIVMISQADWQKTSDSNGNVNYNTHDVSGLFGIIFVAAGTALTATGTVFSIIGTSKVKSYSHKLNTLSITPCITPKQAGFQLTYRF